jgi:hypothetical protein
MMNKPSESEIQDGADVGNCSTLTTKGVQGNLEFANDIALKSSNGLLEIAEFSNFFIPKAA